MSPWDGLLLFIVILAVWRGYRRGFFNRMMSWVGVLFTLYGALRIKTEAVFWLGRFFDGRAFTANAIEKLLEVRYGEELLGTNAAVEAWLDEHFLFAPFREGVMTKMLVGHRDVSPIHALAEVLSTPVWHWIAVAISWFVLFVAVWVISSLLGKLVHGIGPLRIIDAFVGATVSSIMAFVCVGLLTKAVLFLSPESMIGLWASESFFAPLLDMMAKGLVQSLFAMPL